MKIDYGCGEKEIIASTYTLVIYEQEFDGADMIKDVFGRIEITRDEKTDDVIAVFDYTKTNWTALLKALWASLKAADDSIEPFVEWAKNTGSINLSDVSVQLIPEIRRNCFCDGATVSD